MGAHETKKMRKNTTFIVKDIIIVSIFLVLLVVNIITNLKSYGSFSTAIIIEQTVLTIMAFFGLIEIASYYSFNILVPDFYAKSIDRKKRAELKQYIDLYFNQEVNFIKDYNDERISFIISQLGISVEQFDRIRLDLIKMRSLPLKNMDDAIEKMCCCISNGDFPIVIVQQRYDASRLSYKKVDYYINFTDPVFSPAYRKELSSILAFLIDEKSTDIGSINRIVIPYDGNFLLGLEVGKKLNIPVIKMRLDKGKVFSDQPWEGILNPLDRIIVVNDVLVTADQILDTVNKLPSTCEVLGMFCLVSRKEWNGISRLRERNIRVEQVVAWDDKDIRDIIEKAL